MSSSSSSLFSSLQLPETLLQSQLNQYAIVIEKYEDIIQMIKDLNEQQQNMINRLNLGFFGFNWESLIYYEDKYFHTDTSLIAKVLIHKNVFKILYYDSSNSKMFVPKMISFPNLQNMDCFWIQVGKAIIYKTNCRFEYSKLGNFLKMLQEKEIIISNKNKSNKSNNNNNYTNQLYFI